MKGGVLLAGVLVAGSASAQDLLPRDVPGIGAAEVRLGPPAEVRGWAADESPVLIGELRRLAVTGSEVSGGTVQQGDVTLENMTVNNLASLAVEVEEWIGKPLTEVGLERLIEVILRHYEENGRPVNEVSIPPQDPATGTLALAVTEGRIGTVGLGQLQHFDNERVRKGLRTHEGALLHLPQVQRDLDWLSRNPFRRAALFASPGEGVSADLLIQIDERRPWRVYAGYDNSGSSAVGRNRWFAGFNAGNAFGRDHVVAYQFTVGDSLDEFQAHSMSWEIPFHECHQFLRISGGWAEVRSGEPINANLTGTEGSGWEVTAALGTQLERKSGWKQEFSAGIEFKRTDNFFLFGDTALSGTEVDVFQFRGDWKGERNFGETLLNLHGRLVASPGGVTARNDKDDFEAFRNGSDPAYLYGRLGAVWSGSGPDGWSWRLRGDLLAGSGALLPTEQLALGGNASVRGYEERIRLADGGYAISAELSTPPLRAAHPAPGSGMRGVAFLDHGMGWRDDDGWETLTGAGIGTRIRIGDFGEGRLDVGWALDGGDGPEVHAGLFFSF